MLLSLPLSRRRDKVFGLGWQVPLDRHAKFRVQYHALALGVLSEAVRAVLSTLLWDIHDANTGQCNPAYETIAAKAGVGRVTVPRSLAALEDAGILTWQHRRKWVLVAIGGQIVRVVRRTSNGYRFHDPKPAPPPTIPPAHRNDTGLKIQESKRLPTAGAPTIDPQSSLEKALARYGRAVMARATEQGA